MTHHATRARYALTLGASLGALTLALAGAAQAQNANAADEQATTVDEIVVTGFRGSLAQALNIKRR